MRRARRVTLPYITKFLTFPAIDEGSSLGKFKKLFFTSMDNMLGTLLKITKGFFKLVNVLSFNAMGFLNMIFLPGANPGSKPVSYLTALVGLRRRIRRFLGRPEWIPLRFQRSR